ncbi:hypothetical protein BDV25DRAFT_48168 [Aspergillus avenaceus]|uniref:Uncharacterized protein n=1 Tax=Aspergillus avenaceus TaxID=36643 RepID=A0A5N6U303_ASPAV|nr:hypothetical protein BDV25DRAFT_48168 [Aspergillus avenaceus]
MITFIFVALNVFLLSLYGRYFLLPVGVGVLYLSSFPLLFSLFSLFIFHFFLYLIFLTFPIFPFPFSLYPVFFSFDFEEGESDGLHLVFSVCADFENLPILSLPSDHLPHKPVPHHFPSLLVSPIISPSGISKQNTKSKEGGERGERIEI